MSVEEEVCARLLARLPDASPLEILELPALEKDALDRYVWNDDVARSVNSQYRKLSRYVHPDKNSSKDAEIVFSALKKAKEQLEDAGLREGVLRQLAQKEETDTKHSWVPAPKVSDLEAEAARTAGKRDAALRLRQEEARARHAAMKAEMEAKRRKAERKAEVEQQIRDMERGRSSGGGGGSHSGGGEGGQSSGGGGSGGGGRSGGGRSGGGGGSSRGDKGRRKKRSDSDSEEDARGRKRGEKADSDEEERVVVQRPKKRAGFGLF